MGWGAVYAKGENGDSDEGLYLFSYDLSSSSIEKRAFKNDDSNEHKDNIVQRISTDKALSLDFDYDT